MSRVKRGVMTHKRHRKILKQTRGFRGRAKNCFRVAIRRLQKAMLYHYRDRKNKKRTFRSLWIIRINAASRDFGLKYSQLIAGLKLANISLNRKSLAELAFTQPKAFENVISAARQALIKHGKIAS